MAGKKKKDFREKIFSRIKAEANWVLESKRYGIIDGWHWSKIRAPKDFIVGDLLKYEKSSPS